MSDWFVRKNGSDSNAGTSAGAAFLTIQKALNAGVGPTGGDTIWIGAGTYRENLTLNLTSPTSEMKIVGDIDGAKTGDAGEVIVTPYLTNDTTAPTVTNEFNINSKNFITFEKLSFYGLVNGFSMFITIGTNFTMRDCLVATMDGVGGALFTLTVAAGVAHNFLMERCIVAAQNSAVVVIATLTRHTANYDANVVVRNCLFDGSLTVIQASATGSGAGFGGGCYVRQCTLRGSGGIFVTMGSANVSAEYPSITQNCVFESIGGSVESEATPGQVICENIRHRRSLTPISIPVFLYTGNTRAQYPELGQSFLLGLAPRLVDTPLFSAANSPTAPQCLVVQRGQTVTDDATVGTIAWTNPGNAALAHDGAVATASTVPLTIGVTHYLKLLGGLASFPTGGVVTCVRLDVSAATSISNVLANSIKLVKAGVIGGNDGASFNATALSTSQARRIYGSSADPLWGNTLSDTDVQNANFGAVLSFKNTGASNADITVEYARLIVSYTLDGDAQVMTVDLLNRPRPAGLGTLLAQIGCLERHDTGVKETGVVHNGAASLRLDGPADHQFQVPVNAVATTLAIWARYDTNHGATNKPQLSILDAADIGVTAATATMTSAVDTWERIALAFTPTAKGIVTIRLKSRPAAASGIAHFADFPA